MTLRNQLLHAWRGALLEISTQRGPLKAVRAARLLFLVWRELIGTARLAPYGTRALLERRALVSSRRLTVLRYGPRPRNCVEVVRPASSTTRGERMPVVIFVNGGVWSTGDAWQFAPLARRIADEANALVLVATYTLYPAALVPAMIDEVCEAVRFAQRTAPSLGGDPARITVLGHSAGAHLALCALLQLETSVLAFIGMAGVYDVGVHYQFETWRGVQNLSTMEVAMGGKAQFAALSPALHLSTLGPDRRAKLPPLILMSSRSDTTVPSSQSQNLVDIALLSGAEATHVAYDEISHVDFATSWHARMPARRCKDRPQFADIGAQRAGMAHVGDVVTVVRAVNAGQLRTLVQRHREHHKTINPPAGRAPAVINRALLR